MFLYHVEKMTMLFRNTLLFVLMFNGRQRFVILSLDDANWNQLFIKRRRSDRSKKKISPKVTRQMGGLFRRHDVIKKEQNKKRVATKRDVCLNEGSKNNRMAMGFSDWLLANKNFKTKQNNQLPNLDHQLDFIPSFNQFQSWHCRLSWMFIYVFSTTCVDFSFIHIHLCLYVRAKIRKYKC